MDNHYDIQRPEGDNKVIIAVTFLKNHVFELWTMRIKQSGYKLYLDWLQDVGCWEVHTGLLRIAWENEFGTNEAHGVS
jgi:hypothetical protein